MRAWFQAIVLVLLSAASPAAADVLLKVEGVPGAVAPIEYDRAALANLPETRFATSTIWTEGVQEFAGVELEALLSSLGVGQGVLTVVASNDYSVAIPIDQIHSGEALLAYERNGAPMTLRDKGPLWIVYPYDSEERLRNEVVYSRSVWQVVALRIEE